MWVLITHNMEVLLFKEGYMRTSSYAYDLSESKVDDVNIHLTNNAIQKDNDAYGRYEQGNQLGFRHLRQLVKEKGYDFQIVYEQIIRIVRITALSVRRKINREFRKNCFEVFGFDFMLDRECKPWLIEVNTNPSLAESSPVLQ